MTCCADFPVTSFRSPVPLSWTLRAAGPLLLAIAAGCAGPAQKPKVAPAAPVAEPQTTAENEAGDADARFKAALTLLKDRQMQEAREAFFALAKDFPEFSGPYVNLAIIQFQSKQPALAIANLEKATRLNPQNHVALNWLGVAATEVRDYAKAEAAFRESARVKPDYAAAHLNLAVLNDLHLKQPEVALASYREYQRLGGGNELIVNAWIRELEARLAPPAAAPAAATTPAAGDGTLP